MRLLLLLLSMNFGSFAWADTFHFSSGDKKVHLLELYSSQGCSSCPPAQSWVNQLRDSPALWDQVIPVVFHVDYWNYLGWKDPFSKPQFSFRQRAHKRQGNVKSVYTPGFVVNGQEWKGWFRGRDLDLTEVDAGTLGITLHINQLNVMQFDASYIPPDFHSETDVKLHVALLIMDNKTNVLAGENRSRRLEESFIVSDLLTFDMTGFENGKEPDNDYRFSDTVTLQPQIGAFAAWVSDENSLHPIQSTGGYF